MKSENKHQKNLIQWDIRNIFPIINETHSPEKIIEKVHIQQYLEKTEEIYLLNLVTTKGAIDDLNHILMIDNENYRGIALACLGGIHTFNGNYKKAFISFNMALDLPVTDDVKAYIFTELSNLLRKLGYFRECISVLKQAEKVAENEKLIWRIKTYIGFCYKSIDPQYSLSLLKNSISHYKMTKENFRLANIFRHIAGIHLSLEDFTTADRYQNQAMEIAIENSILGYETDVLNDKGWLLISKKEFDKARKLFLELTSKDLTPYQLSLALQNLGYLEFECQNYRTAINYHSQSLQLTRRFEMRDMAFEDYYKLGLCYEKLAEFGLAEHFYQEGYKLLKPEFDLGIPLREYRRKVPEAYIHFLGNNQRMPSLDPFKESLEFTIDKTMREIRKIFHKAFLTSQMKRTKNAPQLCSQLKIDTRTFFLHQKKLGLKRGVYDDSQFKNRHFKDYIDSLAHFSWKEANQHFEDNLFQHLLSRYQYNKKKIADVLQVSYQQVVQKTRSLHK